MWKMFEIWGWTILKVIQASIETLLFLNCEELVRFFSDVNNSTNFHKCEESVPNPHTCEESVPNPHIYEKLVSYHHMWKLGSKSHMCEELVRIPHTCKSSFQICFFFRGLGVFYQREEYACMLYEIWLRACFSQRVRYWYEICDVLVPIFHVLWGIGTNSSQCEIFEVWNLWFNRGSYGYPMVKHLLQDFKFVKYPCSHFWNI